MRVRSTSTGAGSIGAYSGDDDGGPLRPRRDAVGCVKHWDDTFRRRVSKLSATTSRKLLANPDRDRALRDWGIYMRDRGLTHKLTLPTGWETAVFSPEGASCRRVGAPVREGNMLHGVNAMGWPAMCHSGVINPSTRPGRNQKIGMWGTKTRSTAEYYCAINGMLVLAGCAMMVVADVAEPDDAFHSEGERQYVLLGEHRAGTATGFWVRLIREAEIRKSHTHAHFNHAWVPQDEAPIVESPGERVVRFQEDGDDAAVHLLLVATSKAPGFASAASPALPPLQNPSLVAASFHAAAYFLLMQLAETAADEPMLGAGGNDDEHLCNGAWFDEYGRYFSPWPAPPPGPPRSDRRTPGSSGGGACAGSAARAGRGS